MLNRPAMERGPFNKHTANSTTFQKESGLAFGVAGNSIKKREISTCGRDNGVDKGDFSA